MDDLYNNLKVYEAEIKGQSSSNSQNVAFVSSENTSTSSSTYADDVMFSFFANQSNSPQLDNEDLEQIDTDDIEDMDLKWVPRNQGNRNGDAPRRIVPVETPANALVVQNGIGSSSSDSEVHTCSKDCLKSYDTLQKQYDQQCDALNKSNLEIIGYQIGLESLEARIVVHENNEAVYEEDIAFLTYDVQVKDISFKDLKNQLEEALKEKDDLKLKLENFEESLKNLTKLINSQISAKDKDGLGYDSQMNKSEVVNSVFNSKESDVDDGLINDRFKIGEGFHVVPLPYTGNYMPSRPDLSFVGLDDYVYKAKVSETITTASKTSKDSVEKPKTVSPSAPIIEDWDIDSDNDSVFRPKTDQTKPKFTKINFVKSCENVKSVNKENTHRQEEYPRKSQNCDFHDKKMVEKPVLNNKGRVAGQREIRPVWNNAQRMNHQNKITHPHPKRNFVPTLFVTKSGQVPVNAAKQNSPRAAASIITAMPVNTAAPKSKVNDALPKTYSYFKAHSLVRRDFNQKSGQADLDTSNVGTVARNIHTSLRSSARGHHTMGTSTLHEIMGGIPPERYQCRIPGIHSLGAPYTVDSADIMSPPAMLSARGGHHAACGSSDRSSNQLKHAIQFHRGYSDQSRHGWHSSSVSRPFLAETMKGRSEGSFVLPPRWFFKSKKAIDNWWVLEKAGGAKSGFL
ncbi:hypothetical protein Tco_1564272 [Tanacetum coccineum]